MIADIKMAFKLIKYSYNVKMNTIIAVIFSVLGLIIMLVDKGLAITGGIYFILGGMMFAQLLENVLYSNFVLASPKRRKIDVDIINLSVTILSLGGYLFIAVIFLIFAKCRPSDEIQYYSLIVLMGLFDALMLSYFAIAYKYFAFGFIIFIIAFSGLYCYISFKRFSFNIATSGFTAFLTGLFIVIVGCFFSMFIRKILYKKPLSPMAAGMAFKKFMK